MSRTLVSRKASAIATIASVRRFTCLILTLALATALLVLTAPAAFAKAADGPLSQPMVGMAAQAVGNIVAEHIDLKAVNFKLPVVVVRQQRSVREKKINT